MTKTTITLNGVITSIESDLTISQLIKKLELDIKKIAVEKDYEIINQDDFEKVILNDGSKVEIVHFIGGG